MPELSPEQIKSQKNIEHEAEVQNTKAYPVECLEQAIKDFDHAEGEISYEELWQNISVLFQHKEYKLASALIEKIINKYPGDFAALNLKAQTLTLLGRNQEAIEVLEPLNREYCSHQIKFLMAENLYLMGADDFAFDMYIDSLSAADLNPENMFQILKNLGNIQVKKGQYERAEEYYLQAAELDPQSDALMVNFGTLEVQKKNYDKAREFFQEGIYLNPSNDKAWTGLALMNREYGDFELSWANIKRAIELNPNNESALELGVDWAIKDQKKDFICQFLETQVFELEKDLGLLLIRLYVGFKEYKNAIIAVERFMENSPENMSLKTLLENLTELYTNTQG